LRGNHAALDVKASGKGLNFTISIGAAKLHSSDPWARDVLRRAEQALDDAIERAGDNAVIAKSPPTPAEDTGK
jgi:PleD family two-component response regulator